MAPKAKETFHQILQGDAAMSIGLVLIILLAVMLFGGFSGRFGGYGYGYGHRGVGIIGIALIVIVVLAVTNQL
jgi:uncharacterized membrane protein